MKAVTAIRILLSIVKYLKQLIPFPNPRSLLIRDKIENITANIMNAFKIMLMIFLIRFFLDIH